MHAKKVLDYLRALRLERWPRSFAIYVGTFSFFLLNPKSLAFHYSVFLALLFAFFLTWAVSTANYIINEIADAPFDQHHPVKKTRPLAAGLVSRNVLGALFVLFAVGALGMGYAFFSTPFVLSLVALLIAGLLYNVPPFRLKDIPFLDFISESINNPIRFLIGWYSFGGESFPPILLLLWWWACGMFLMVGKRISEKRFLGVQGSGAYRPSLKRVTEPALRLSMLSLGILSLLFIVAFALKYRIMTFLIFSLPMAGFFFWMFWVINRKRGELEEPEEILQNPFLSILLFLITAFFLLSLYLERFSR